MKQSKETLKEHFETGDKPTQEQYSDLIDSYIDSKQEAGEPNRRLVIDETGDVSVTSEVEIPEYNLSEIENNKLSLLKDGVAIQEIDLTSYIDDTNLARLVNGTLDSTTRIATFLRDDETTFTVDFSSMTPELSFSDNGDDTYTFNNGDDSLTIDTSVNETLTSQELIDDSLNYIDENGNTTTTDLSKYNTDLTGYATERYVDESKGAKSNLQDVTDQGTITTNDITTNGVIIPNLSTTSSGVFTTYPENPIGPNLPHFIRDNGDIVSTDRLSGIWITDSNGNSTELVNGLALIDLVEYDNFIYTINKADNHLYKISHTGIILDLGEIALTEPYAMYVNSIGDIYIQSQHPNSFSRYIIIKYKQDGTTTSIGFSFDRPRQMVFDSNDTAYLLLNNDERVAELSLDNSLNKSYATLTGSLNNNSIAIDNQDNLYVSGRDSLVYKIDPLATVTNFFSIGAGVYNLIVDETNTVYAAGSGDTTIYITNSAGQSSTAELENNYYSGMVTDNNSNVFFSTNKGNILETISQGTSILYTDSNGKINLFEDVKVRSKPGTLALTNELPILVAGDNITVDYTNNPRVEISLKNSLSIAPTSPIDTGTKGDVRYTSSGIYVCIATDTWIKTLLETGWTN